MTLLELLDKHHVYLVGSDFQGLSVQEVDDIESEFRSIVITEHWAELRRAVQPIMDLI